MISPFGFQSGKYSCRTPAIANSMKPSDIKEIMEDIRKITVIEIIAIQIIVTEIIVIKKINITMIHLIKANNILEMIMSN